MYMHWGKMENIYIYEYKSIYIYKYINISWKYERFTYIEIVTELGVNVK